MVKKALGKGLSALLPEAERAEELLELDIDLLEVNEAQPRTRFDEKRLEELAESIKENGLVQPILVRRTHGGKYQIIAGERRWRAAQRAGLLKIAAVVREVSDDKLLELALVENIARQELNPIEEAIAYQKLISRYGLTQEQIARRVGKDRSSVTNILRLLKLPEGIQVLVEDEKISMGHARALLPVEDEEYQMVLAQRVISEGLSVRDLERLVERWRSPAEAKEERRPVDPNLKAAEQRLQKRLGTQVKILLTKNGGRIQIEFHSEEELSRIYDLLTTH